MAPRSATAYGRADVVRGRPDLPAASRSTVSSVFVGRSDERALVRELADAARSGRGRAVVLTGPPGIGLTSLVGQAVIEIASDPDGGPDSGTHLDVIAIQARSSERELYRTVLRDLADQLDSPPFTRAVAEAPDAELPSRLLDAIAARSTPVLVVVDDADATDPASAVALAFVARRLARLPVSMVLTCHHAASTGFDDLPESRVSGLTVDELGTLLAARVEGAAIEAGVVDALHRAIGGHPKLAVDVARSLTTAQRSGVEPFPTFPSVTADAVAGEQASLAGLSLSARRALTLVACEPSGDIRVIGRAAAALDVDLAALEEAEEVGFVTIDAGVVHFDQPLRRLAAYHAVAAPSRRAAHRALAAAFDAPTDAEHRALHLALGTAEPDERIAADVELAAQAAERRGDHGAARQWWLHASRLSPVRADADTRARRARSVGGVSAGPLSALTEGERRVAEVVGTGVSNKAAASALHVSVKTVDTHLQSIYRKLGLRSRGELAVVMARLIGSSATPGAPAMRPAPDEFGRGIADPASTGHGVTTGDANGPGPVGPGPSDGSEGVLT
jgi:DNA-binding CsgD family transcriptional regulator